MKPTKIGGSLEVDVPQQKNPNAVARGQGPKKESAELSRWMPGMMRSIAVEGDDMAGALQSESRAVPP